MCLVEIEGIPKLQTACSTPVRDGMVVHTQTQRVHEAQRAVVEFLLINHPLDCPVCDKGGECPLQDITYGWGPGTSRFIEPKRHFKKPLELSPLIAIDRERCILCYRCVRFSQEISEDYQLVLLERGAHSFVGTFDGHPYVAPFSGNIIELCPVGALTSRAYRFRARPWDIEGAGTVCTLCPAQCNVELTVRDERVMRVLSRDHDDVDDGWLCDKGRFAYQHVHTDERLVQPLVREGTQPAARELGEGAGRGGRRAEEGGRQDRGAGRRRDHQRGGVPARQAAARGARLRASCRSRPEGELPLDVARALADPALQATVPDLEFAHAVLLVDADPIDDAPVWDLRIRKGVRRHGVRVGVVSARPTALDTHAELTLRHAPGTGEALLVALDAALSRRPRQPRRRGQHGRLERRRGQGAGGLPQGRRGPRDRLRRAAARRSGRRPGGARAAQPRLPPRPLRARRRGPARGARRRQRARRCARPASRPATAPATRRVAEPGRDARGHRRGARLRRALDGLAAPRRPAPLASPTAPPGRPRSATPSP